MRFGAKLTLFLFATLLVIQTVTGAAIYTLLRGTLVEDGKARVTSAATQFVLQLDQIEQQMVAGVRLLTLDFALRQAIAEHDSPTVVSALLNHGRRVGAANMQLVGLEGAISAETDPPRHAADANTPRPFPWPDLLEKAALEGHAATVAVVRGTPVWLVVLPVMAPDPIAFVAAEMALDDRLLDRTRALTALPGQIAIAVATSPGAWRNAAGQVDDALLRLLPHADGAGGDKSEIVMAEAAETIFLSRRLPTPAASPAVAAVIGYPLSDALRRYEKLIVVLLMDLALGLGAALLGAAAIARGVARPVEQLAAQMGRIEAGDYTPPEPIARRDELGALSVGLGRMTRAIHAREVRILFQATHDPVTGLANREALTETIDRWLANDPATQAVRPASDAATGLAVHSTADPASRPLGDPFGAPFGDPGGKPREDARGNASGAPLDASRTSPPSDALAHGPGRQEQSGRGGVVLVIVLVRWQDVVNTVGRDIADRLMREAGARLGGMLEPAALGCIGERSFAAFLPGAEMPAALTLAARIIAAFEQPYQEDALTMDAAAAIGLAIAPDHGRNAALLLRHAEVAVQNALQDDSRSVVYRPDIDPHRPDLLSLMSDLRQGLQRREFSLLFQPKIDVATGLLSGAEALVRWDHPARGAVPVESFIRLAEETGNIQHLTRWVLAEGIAEAARWRAHGVSARVSINLSVRDLADAELPSRIMRLLADHRLPAQALVLEVTESAIMGEPDAAIAVLRRFADQGIDLAIDDFGVGHSSLAYLRRLPVREIKIDKAFVLKLPHSQDDQMIVRSVIELGHNLGYRVTAEGVEDASSLSLLRQFGCDHAQGFLIARPLPADAFLRFAGEACGSAVAAW